MRLRKAVTTVTMNNDNHKEPIDIPGNGEHEGPMTVNYVEASWEQGDDPRDIAFLVSVKIVGTHIESKAGVVRQGLFLKRPGVWMWKGQVPGWIKNHVMARMPKDFR